MQLKRPIFGSCAHPFRTWIRDRSASVTSLGFSFLPSSQCERVRTNLAGGTGSWPSILSSHGGYGSVNRRGSSRSSLFSLSLTSLCLRHCLLCIPLPSPPCSPARVPDCVSNAHPCCTAFDLLLLLSITTLLPTSLL